MIFLSFIKKHYKSISSLILLGSLIPFILLSFYSRPSADDYGYSLLIRDVVLNGKANVFTVLKAAFETDMKYYQSWQGLYVAAFLQSLQPGVYGEQYYFITAFAMMLPLFIASYYLIKTLYRSFNIDYSPMFSSIVLFTIFVHGLPSPIQGIYWYCGAADYIPFIVLNMFNFAFLLNYYDSENAKGSIYLALSVICSFLLSGGNHVNSFLNILMLLVLCVVSCINKKKYGSFLSLLSALAGFGIMLIAPGTRVRMNSLNGAGVFETIYATFFRFIRLVFSNIYMNVRFFLFLLLLLFLAAHNRENKKIHDLKIHPILLFLTFCMFLCGMLAVPYFAMGTFGSGRLKNIIWIAYMLMAGMFWFYTLIWLSDRIPFIAKALDRIRNIEKGGIVIVVSILLILSSGYFFPAIRELSDGTAKAFAQQYDERIETARNYQGDEVLRFEPLVSSDFLKFDDLYPDPDFWINKDWAEYYGTPAVALKTNEK